MAKGLSEREKELLFLAAYFLGEYRDSNPDGGWGSSAHGLVHTIVKKSGGRFPKDDVEEVIERLSNQRQRG